MVARAGRGAGEQRVLTLCIALSAVVHALLLLAWPAPSERERPRHDPLEVALLQKKETVTPPELEPPRVVPRPEVPPRKSAETARKPPSQSPSAPSRPPPRRRQAAAVPGFEAQAPAPSTRTALLAPPSTEELTPAPPAGPRAEAKAPAPEPALPVATPPAPRPEEPSVATAPVSAEAAPPLKAAAPGGEPRAGAPPPGAGRPGAAASADSRPVTPPSFNAAYLRNPPPRYPIVARRNGEEGAVTLRVRVTVDGRAATVTVEQSSGSPSLDRAALEAVRTWRFVPARSGADPVEAWVLVPVVFRLDGVS
jgi:periplasmic protein TonB